MKQKRKTYRLKSGALELISQLQQENPYLVPIFKYAKTLQIAKERFKKWLEEYISDYPRLQKVYEEYGSLLQKETGWRGMALVRILDYMHYDGLQLHDPNLSNATIISRPIENLWRAIRFEKGNCNEAFCLDMLFLFRQLNGKLKQNKPSRKKVMRWMLQHPSGLDEEIQSQRRKNRDRIIRKIIQNIESGRQASRRFRLNTEASAEEKYEQVSQWWTDYRFHLSFAIRNPDLLNEMLDHSLSDETMSRLYDARKKGIPLFVNPHYLSLLCVSNKAHCVDQAIRDYVFPSRKLIEQFGKIEAWEKEDKVSAGEPNAAGWILPPFHNVHRRYPEVAIFIPDTTGRACGGLCVSCQRMYDFQSGHFNFDLKKLKAPMRWPEKMKLLLDYFEKDTQLRDILITGGDAFMSSNAALRQILDAVYQMAFRKKQANQFRKKGDKYAEIVRVRLGTRLPVYIPQRIDDELCNILRSFREKAEKIGIQQFIIQSHVESAMEITPETKRAVEKLLNAGWLVTNQLVFTTAASVRGHTAKLRQVLNDIGVISYYTFSVKGFMENYHNFATNARSVQEEVEEKRLGMLDTEMSRKLAVLHKDPSRAIRYINEIREKEKKPFLATDRNMLNLPGVGKSMSFRVVGITDDGRRILLFQHDPNRKHSPIIHQMGEVLIVESKSISKYLRQIKKMGKKAREYKSMWGYSMSETEPRAAVFEYPPDDGEITPKITHLELKPKNWKESSAWQIN